MTSTEMVAVSKVVSATVPTTATEIVAVSRTIIEMARDIQSLGKNFYRASADWADFPQDIDNLSEKCRLWLAGFGKTGKLSDSDVLIVEILRDVQAVLEKEIAKLESQATSCGWFEWYVCHGVVKSRITFPAKLRLSIKILIDAFNPIQGGLEFEGVAVEKEAAVTLDKKMLGSVPISNDDRYVPLKDTESKVHTALEGEGFPVVLLHGGPGKGKSTLARHVALHYQRRYEDADAIFKPVVFLEGGTKAEVRTKQFKLVQLLGSSTTAASQEQRQTGANVEITKELSGLLKDRRILIIFDDVSDRGFLQEMLNLCGDGVKFLVTSQNGSLCVGLKSNLMIAIQIEDLQQDVAMEILASHVGFADRQIPKVIQGEALKLIEYAERNPLALAIIATAIDSARSAELKEWEAASDNFLQLLHSDDTACVLGKKYPKNPWAAMQSSIKSLRKEVQNLLILLCMCGGTCVPEEVLKILYLSAVLQVGSETFEKSRKDLESQQLVKISCESLAHNNLEKERSWSLNSLAKQFINDEMKDQIREMMLKVVFEVNRTRKLSAEDDTMVQISLCALYFDEQFSSEIKSKIDILPIQLNRLRRNAIEPITRLLGLHVSERWTKAAESSTKQIFLQYIYNSALHNSGISELLALPISVLPMLRALEDISKVESETTLIDENSGALVEALVRLLEDTGDATIATSAARIFERLSLNRSHSGVILSSGILEVLFKCVCDDNNINLQRTAEFVLRNLARLDTDGTRLRMMDCPGLREKFFNALSKGHLCWGYIEALTYIDARRGNAARLDSTDSYQGRAFANLILGLNKEALEDVERANRRAPQDLKTLRLRRTVRARNGDLKGALADANTIVERERTRFDLQERGVLKRMMEDLSGALEDLTESLEFDPNDYEVLKQRAVVKFLMKDEDGARSDAEMARRATPIRIHNFGYERECLGTTSVKFLNSDSSFGYDLA